MDIRAKILWFAANWRLKADDPFIVAVTGSIAKTSTKEATGAVLSHAFGSSQVRTGFGNLNTELGLPLAILGYRIDFHKQKVTWQWPFILLGAIIRSFLVPLPRYLVLEMGADKPGDLAKLTAHIRPNIGVVTFIGEAHLMNYANKADLAKEKAEVIRSVRAGGVAIINRRDPFREYLAKQAAVSLVEFDCATSEIAHTVAETIGKQLNIKSEAIGHALSSSWQPAGRMRILEGRYTIVDDSYNASPTSMAAALEKLQRMPNRKVAILGSMLELGSDELEFHEKVGALAHKSADFVVGVGDLAKHYRPDQWFATSDEAAKGVVAFLQKGDSILVKGSHGIRTDIIVEALQ